MDKEKLQQIQFLRQMLREPQEGWTGKKEQAIRKAEEFTERTGIKAMVIRKKRKYDWVAEPYFDTYDYKGKIYYETTPKLDAEL